MRRGRRLWSLGLLAASACALAAVPGMQVTATGQVAGRPNILVIVTDDQRIQTMSVLPRTSSWFRDGGTAFPNAFVTTPLCCPSRASIFTGEYAHNHGITVNPEGFPVLNHDLTIEKALHDAGYATAIDGKFLNSWDITQAPPYFDRYALQVGYGYRDPSLNVDGTVAPVPGFATDVIGDLARGTLADFETNDAQPWFLYVAPIAPHRPYGVAGRYQDAPVGRWKGNPAVFEQDRSDKPPFVRQQSATLAEGRSIHDQQLRSLMAVDDVVDGLFTDLQALGEENTIAIFVSDNGYLWGEHGVNEAKRLPYLQSVQVPLFLQWPGHVAAGAADGRLVANIDIAPTLLDAAGLAPDTLPVDGMSLLQPTVRKNLLLEYRQSPDAPAFPSWDAMISRHREYVEWLADDATTVIFQEYYDLRDDPWQLENVLADGITGNEPSLATAKTALARLRACAGAACLP